MQRTVLLSSDCQSSPSSVQSEWRPGRKGCLVSRVDFLGPRLCLELNWLRPLRLREFVTYQRQRGKLYSTSEYCLVSLSRCSTSYTSATHASPILTQDLCWISWSFLTKHNKTITWFAHLLCCCLPTSTQSSSASPTPPSISLANQHHHQVWRFILLLLWTEAPSITNLPKESERCSLTFHLLIINNYLFFIWLSSGFFNWLNKRVQVCFCSQLFTYDNAGKGSAATLS